MHLFTLTGEKTLNTLDALDKCHLFTFEILFDVGQIVFTGFGVKKVYGRNVARAGKEGGYASHTASV